jgi:hypothetical protein
MAYKNPSFSAGGRPPEIILRSEIEEAQKHTNSNMAAARWLNVSYKRYKKYAELYGLFERHLNPAGFGIDKGMSKRPTSIPLRDVLAGKHPKYSLAKLKNRLIARKKIKEECACCGFNERRITDKKVPLMITFADGNHSNFSLANLQLYCYNCMFLTTGAPSVVNRNLIEKSFIDPESITYTQQIPMTVADSYDPTEDDALYSSTVELTEEERQALYNTDDD